MESYLRNIFTETNNQLERLLQRVMGGNLEDQILEEVLGQLNAFADPIR